jgi:hypothetical protein
MIMKKEGAVRAGRKSLEKEILGSEILAIVHVFMIICAQSPLLSYLAGLLDPSILPAQTFLNQNTCHYPRILA